MIKPPGKPGIAIYFSAKTAKKDTYVSSRLPFATLMARSGALPAREGHPPPGRHPGPGPARARAVPAWVKIQIG